jgi:hypothetical protein
MASKMNNTQTNVLEIFNDLKERLGKANGGKGMKLSELDPQRFMEYLENMGIAKRDISTTMSQIQSLFTGKTKVKPNTAAKDANEELYDESSAATKAAGNHHPFTKTKQAPRKNVFGQIKKIK